MITAAFAIICGCVGLGAWDTHVSYVDARSRYHPPARLHTVTMLLATDDSRGGDLWFLRDSRLDHPRRNHLLHHQHRCECSVNIPIGRMADEVLFQVTFNIFSEFVGGLAFPGNGMSSELI